MSRLNKMLIDATHPEETRVVVVRDGRVEEFDFESASRLPLRGNIYLAKITRVEPSLQAAFVEYGGNRHGFLAFNEIHPDYYQIPTADRIALLEEEAAQEAAEEAEADAHAERLARRREGRPDREERPERSDRGGRNGRGSRGRDRGGRPRADRDAGERDEAPTSAADAGDPIETLDTQSVWTDAPAGTPASMADVTAGPAGDDAPAQHGMVTSGEAMADEGAPAHGEAGDGQSTGGHRTLSLRSDSPDDVIREAPRREAAPRPTVADDEEDTQRDDGRDDDDGLVQVEPQPVEIDIIEPEGHDDHVEEVLERPRRRMRSYKIQDVIKRRQVVLVQVVKEERGNKGAALTTYLSLAGRYTVLMPNTARGGGISRKITNTADRKRLKAAAQDLDVPEGMGLIVRTAGAARTGPEIKRDFEYLLRLWENVRELTLQSTAPTLVYEEGNLIKRSIRDLYNKEIDEIIVAGDAGYREARDFMRMLTPTLAKSVTHYQGVEPLLARYRVEQQLAALFSPQVTLKSGGYIVINQTEALVAVDVNSGKSTREYSIEETALNTNLEAADEVARQVKLRDLAGLIVIDFIDMEEKRNNRAVERRLKDALRNDRARIQLGRISHFGLMEMSRQRLRTGMVEGSTSQCPHCLGSGIVRSIESIALAVLRGIEDALMGGTRMAITATTTPQVALYILNTKRGYIVDMEARHGLPILVQGSDKLQGANFTIDKVAAPVDAQRRRPVASPVNMEWGFDGDSGEEGSVLDAEEAEADEGTGQPSGEPRGSEGQNEGDGEGESDGEGRRRRRRRGRRGRRGERDGLEAANDGGTDAEGSDDSEGDDIGGADDSDGPFTPSAAAGRVSRDSAADDSGGEGVPRDGDADNDDERGDRRGRRRGRRGGRRGNGAREGEAGEATFTGANDDRQLLHGAAGVIAYLEDGSRAPQPDAASGFDVHGAPVTTSSADAGPAGPAEAAFVAEPRPLRVRPDRRGPNPRSTERDGPTPVAETMPALADGSATDSGATVSGSATGGSAAVSGAMLAAAMVTTEPSPAEATVERTPMAPAVSGTGADTPAGTNLPIPATTIAAEPAARAAEPVATPEPARPRRAATSSSEPVLERVVVRPGATEREPTAEAKAATASAPAEDAPAATDPSPSVRRGWWQRKLGLA